MSKQSQALEKQYEKEEGISSVEESGGEDWYTPSFFEWLLEKAYTQEITIMTLEADLAEQAHIRDIEIEQLKANNAEMLLALNLCYCASQTGGIVQKEIDAIKAIIDRHTKEGVGDIPEWMEPAQCTLPTDEEIDKYETT